MASSTRPGTSDTVREERILDEMLEADRRDRQERFNPKGNNNTRGTFPNTQPTGGKHRGTGPLSKHAGRTSETHQMKNNLVDKYMKGGDSSSNPKTLEKIARKAAQKFKSLKKKRATENKV